MTRVTDASYQPGANRNVKKMRSMDEPNTFNVNVPEITEKQKAATAANRQAHKDMATARQVASEAASVARVLKKVSDDAAVAARAADEDLKDKEVAAQKAMLAKKQADEDTLAEMNTEEEMYNDPDFLGNAFDHFDVDKVGNLKMDQFPAILKSLNMPSVVAATGLDAVEELFHCMDANKNELVSRREWVKYMPLQTRSRCAATRWPRGGRSECP